MRRQIPNLLTLCNLLCGALAIVSIIESYSTPIAYFIWTACAFDFLDGFAARWLKVTSPMGKELDSLADMVSFGLVPALLMYRLLAVEYPAHGVPFIALILAAAAALRLANFNIDPAQTSSFRGLPTPANALFITSLPFVKMADYTLPGEVLVVVTIVLAYLMVSPLALFSLKFKSLKWKDNRHRFTFLALSVLLLALVGLPALPLVILLYIGISLVVKTVD